MGFAANDGYVSFGRQSAKGTGVAPSKFGRFITAVGNPTNEIKEFREGGFEKEGAFAEKVGMIFPFSVNLYARPDIIGLLATMILGSDTVSGAGPYDHLIVPKVGQLDWWSVEFQRVNDTLVERLVDCKPTSLVLTGSAGEFIEATVEGQGLNDDASVSAATPSYEADKMFKFLQGAFTIFGGANLEITEFTLTVTMDTEFIQAAGLVYQQAVDKFVDVTLDMTLKCTQDDEYRRIYFGGASGNAPDEALEASQVVLVFNNGLAAAAERELSITIPEFSYFAADLTGLSAEGDVYYYALSGKATYDGTGPLVQFDVKNNESSEYDA